MEIRQHLIGFTCCCFRQDNICFAYRSAPVSGLSKYGRSIFSLVVLPVRSDPQCCIPGERVLCVHTCLSKYSRFAFFQSICKLFFSPSLHYLALSLSTFNYLWNCSAEEKFVCSYPVSQNIVTLFFRSITWQYLVTCIQHQEFTFANWRNKGAGSPPLSPTVLTHRFEPLQGRVHSLREKQNTLHCRTLTKCRCEDELFETHG